jgi:pilus assembly protein TadC
MRKLSLIEQDGGFILESRKEVRIVSKKVKALLMTLKDFVTIFMIAVCLCYGFNAGNLPIWLVVVAGLHTFADIAVWFYKGNLRRLGD